MPSSHKQRLRHNQRLFSESLSTRSNQHIVSITTCGPCQLRTKGTFRHTAVLGWCRWMDRLCHQSSVQREKKHPNSASCRFFFRVVNYSVPCHLGWPFWGQNNLSFSCLWLCSVHCPYQSSYKRTSHSYASAATWSQQDISHCSQGIYCLRDFTCFLVSHGIPVGCLPSNFSSSKTVCEGKTNYSFTTLIFFFSSVTTSPSCLSVPLCSFLLSSDRNMCRSSTEERQWRLEKWLYSVLGSLGVTLTCSRRLRLHHLLLNASDAALSGLTLIPFFMYLFLSFKEQHPNKCANAMTNVLLWSVDSLTRGPLDRTHIWSYEKAPFKLVRISSLRITPGQNLELHISAHPHIKFHPGATEKQEPGFCEGEITRYPLVLLGIVQAFNEQNM